MRTSVPKVKVLRDGWAIVKLQRQLSRHYGGKAYPKWVLVLPPKLIEELGWEEGQELEAEIAGKDMRVRPVRGRG